MIRDEIINKLVEQTSHYIRENKVSLSRDSKEFVTSITNINFNLTLPILKKDILENAIFIKNLYALWNALIDDEMDTKKTKRYLDKSNYFLSLLEKDGLEAKSQHKSDPSTTLIYDIFSLIGNKTRSDAIVFEFREVINGFYYEHFINHNPSLATALEYSHYSAVTAGPKIYLDIDIALSDKKILVSDYKNLRLGLDYISRGIKYASDVSGLHRELTVEKSLNIVSIKALESQVLDLNTLGNSAYSFDKIIEILKPFIRETTDEAYVFYDQGEKFLKKVTGLDIAMLADSLKKVIDTYINYSDKFFVK